jgi:putative endopeptidase
MKYRYFTIAMVAAAVGFAAFRNGNTTTAGSKGIDLGNFNTSANPAQDFYEYVNGNWMKNNPIPATESAWGSFNEVRERNTVKLKTVLDEAANDKNAKPGSNRQKIGDYYAMATDSAKLEKDGIKPLADEFAMIDRIKTTDDLAKVVAHHHTIGAGSIFGFGVGQDPKISTQYIAFMGQGGTALPEKDYYLGDDPELKQIRDAYVDHIGKMLALTGDKQDIAGKEAQTIMNIETALSKVSMSAVEQRNIEAQYNKRTLKELKEMVPNFNWDIYFKNVGIAPPAEVIIGQLDFMKEMNNMVKSTSINDWKTYLRWSLINATASKLNEAIVKQNFSFYGTTLMGAKAQRPRWKRALDAVDEAMGEALGQVYVEKYFSATDKQRVNTMVDNLMAAYKDRINTRDWMSADTKKQAITKLNTIMRKLAYPDKWRDYSALQVKRDSYVQNFMRANTFGFNYMINKLGKPVDRTEWGMSPPTINAYYNPSMNEIVFPAGIMQPPFFNPEADDAVNYGSMGAVIGHELTHGFDDQGSQFDAEGNMKNWWTDEDKKKFEAKTQLIVKQFNKFVAVDSAHVNGELTLGENIADLGGLTIAYYAYKKSLEGKSAPEKIDGFTGEQRFFIAWAQAWRTNMRPEFMKQMVKTNPHSPGRFRVLGPLSNMKEFYAAFNVKPGDAMYRNDNERAEIW